MSKTARTDANVLTDNEYLMENIGLVDFVRAGFARQLETELAETEKKVFAYKTAFELSETELAEARAEIKNWKIGADEAADRAVRMYNALEKVLYYTTQDYYREDEEHVRRANRAARVALAAERGEG